MLNECFGHFVRDNFRNNKEDGQYMTPYEVSTHLSEIITHELIENYDLVRKINTGEFKVLDPTCGVGTLLTELFNALQFNKKLNDYDMNELKNNCFYGQDKIDRMVRLSKINFVLKT